MNAEAAREIYQAARKEPPRNRALVPRPSYFDGFAALCLTQMTTRHLSPDAALAKGAEHEK